LRDRDVDDALGRHRRQRGDAHAPQSTRPEASDTSRCLTPEMRTQLMLRSSLHGAGSLAHGMVLSFYTDVCILLPFDGAEPMDQSRIPR